MMDEFRYDQSQFAPLKLTLEQILGRKTYLKLKETGTLDDWKKEVRKLLKAIKLSIDATIKIADSDFFHEVDQIIKPGDSHIAVAANSSELFSSLSATLARIVFLQIGFLPKRQMINSAPLIAKNWTLDCVRTVQYLQTGEQKETAERLKASGKI